jgi:hypothetical protein
MTTQILEDTISGFRQELDTLKRQMHGLTNQSEGGWSFLVLLFALMLLGGLLAYCKGMQRSPDNIET